MGKKYHLDYIFYFRMGVKYHFRLHFFKKNLMRAPTMEAQHVGKVPKSVLLDHYLRFA